jgi:nucleotide-binding universal stress UspA family protein
MAGIPPLFNCILVPTDGSQSSMTAGRMAVRLAALNSARLTFLYVVDTAVAGGLAKASGREADGVQEELSASGRHYLDYLSRLAAEAGLESEQRIRMGEPHEEIDDLARAQGADLIVIGQVSGGRGLQRILIGGVTERVIENAPCPVLVVR